MTKLGTWPEDRYCVSWMTQRLANRAPQNTLLRQSVTSMGQQVLNPIGLEIQRVSKQITSEKNNIFLTSANTELLGELSYLELGVGMEFQKVESNDGTFSYSIPRAFGTISGVEYELTIASKNDLNSLAYTAVPSRIEDGEISYVYEEVIPRVAISDLANTTPNSPVLEGHLYISIFNNTTWEYRGVESIYYPKIVINGRTRKGTDVTEAIPVQYNGTFKSVNQWKTINDIFVSYMDDTAEIAVEVLPFAQESFSDTQNLIVNSNGVESFRFVELGTHLWGNTILSKGFTVPDLRTIQLGFEEKDTEYEIELLDEAGSNISANALAINNNLKYCYVIDNNYLYIYNQDLPYPDLTNLQNNSTNTKMRLLSDRWVLPRDEVAVVNTDTLDVSTVPWKFRWVLIDPNGDTWYLGLDGSKWPPTIDAWIDNQKWEEGYWDEQRLEIALDIRGTYVLTLECMYTDPYTQGEDEIFSTRHLLYVPSIEPEATLELPTELKNSTDLMFDSDNKLWLKKDDNIQLLNIYYDYFLVDYDRKTVWFRENYSQVRVVV